MEQSLNPMWYETLTMHLLMLPLQLAPEVIIQVSCSFLHIAVLFQCICNSGVGL